MKKRLDALKRIERLQRQMQDLANWRLATLAREREALAQAHREMIEALGREPASYGPLAAAATRRVRAIEREIETAAATHKAQAGRAMDQAARARLAEHALGVASAVCRAQRERKQLSELIERSLGAAKASSA